ncbi:hypothetical protein [Corynebacterium guaraldiae]|uniref:hypothetical protein n=1 Tax=Corynebacterium guaraldiae TaxID=3051103 RepID=UPI00163DBA0C|nr:hypothetical protein [Corynebacterium guaraldiae]
MNDLIQHQDCRITITHGLDREGELLFSVHVDGDMPYVSTLGLLEAAKDHLKKMFTEEE